MNPESVLVQVDGAVALLTLNDPPKNPIGLDTMDRLESLIPEIAVDRSVRAVIFTGSGTESFSVGANLKELGKAVSERTLQGFTRQRHRVFAALENLPKPTIAAVHGTCLGGGLELALSCHFRIASEGTKFALPEIHLGALPAWGGTQRLPRIVGRAHALDMMLTGRHVGAEEALRMGLVREVAPPAELLPRAKALAADLAQKAPLAVAGILRAVIEGEEMPLSGGLELELEAFERAAKSKDNLEGVAAFLQKRKPVFRGE